MYKYKVLILDGGAILPPTTVVALNLKGYEVDIAQDYTEGLQALAIGGYQLVIFREELMGTAAWLCLEIRQLTGIPIIVISGDTSKQAFVRTIRAGADYFLREPVSSLELLARVNALLRRTRPAPFELSRLN